MQICQMPAGAILQLNDVLDRECVRPVEAQGQQMVDHWQADHMAYLTEGQAVRELPEAYLPLVEQAISEWVERFKRFLTVFGNSETNFIIWFTRTRNAARAGQLNAVQDQFQGEHMLLHYSTELSRNVVSNIGWPTAFGSYLPRALPDKELEASAIGFQMAAIMWLETFAKSRVHLEFFQSTEVYDRDRYYKLDALLDVCDARLN